ncbi:MULTISPECIES: hypothetical protein [Burkholderia]|uniref:hypothetical protein n=1 Tax=Burkholderia TaxID=32008 RepID=UPI00117818AB|nr:MULTISPECIES: hypothetical protein [Burkholderia]EKS9797652.1 hypothetical protein [Burkholderia cepacia]EKS9805362.1 hypothetical protein [Burkholderia cepacia]EKS9813270.1 hypothetical protein [Burkholderia cepacia]EKS9818606.1 hypothetical protein [Burkholderia cepacia]EKS9826345.1 hypothetical protein [Burkholderia cepacia]
MSDRRNTRSLRSFDRPANQKKENTSIFSEPAVVSSDIWKSHLQTNRQFARESCAAVLFLPHGGACGHARAAHRHGVFRHFKKFDRFILII